MANEWESACRLCSEEKSEMLSIFGDEGLQRKVAQKMRACFPVMVYKTDPLPKQICQFCAARLDDAYEFREHCLNVYKSMHAKLIIAKDSEAVLIFLEAMKSSPDPCQAQLCQEKARAPPPLVPLPASLPLEKPLPPVIVPERSKLNNNSDPLPELPCEVQIKEEPTDSIVRDGSMLTELSQVDNSLEEIPDEPMIISQEDDGIIEIDDRLGENKIERDGEYKSDNLERPGRTSILEQVLTGSLTMNDRKELKPRSRLSTKWWCAPCNSYYRTKESLRKHMRVHCPRRYRCRKCSTVFHSVEDLAKHEGSNHLKITLDFDETIKECELCEREFVSWEMLRRHRLRDHQAESLAIGTDTWCPPCNRFFPSMELYQSHKQLHQPDATMPIPPVPPHPRILEPPKNPNKEHFVESIKSLTCPTCGKVCTQQSALSNHMRTHEPKKHKCEICGRSFGLFIRLAAHRLSEHNQQPVMTPVMTSVEQEEALNAEREAREAREARSRRGRNKSYVELPDEDVLMESMMPEKTKTSVTKNMNTSKNVARCGICLQWFSDHTTMLTHLQTHSDSFVHKSFNCRLCKKTFKEKWQLLRHEVSHKRGNVVVYTCSTCSKTFTDKAQHKSHEATHVVDKTYHCPKCNKIFFKEFSLMTHQCTGKPIFGKKNLTPKVTPKVSPKVSLKVSSKLPTKSPLSFGSSKKYKCSKCNATFNNSQSRNSHMRVHTEAHAMLQVRKQELKKELGLDSMPKLTPETLPGTSMSLIQPKVEIKEENPPAPVKRTLIRTAGGYRCGVCQSPFVLRELAVAHLRSAHPVMPYQCPYCKKRFSTQYTFTHHIKTEHPDESEK